MKEIDIDDTGDDDNVKVSPAESVGILVDARSGWDETEGVEAPNQLVPANAPKNLAIPPFLNLDPDQQQAAVQMTHYLNSLMCMVSEHFTSLER